MNNNPELDGLTVARYRDDTTNFIAGRFNEAKFLLESAAKRSISHPSIIVLEPFLKRRSFLNGQFKQLTTIVREIVKRFGNSKRVLEKLEAPGVLTRTHMFELDEWVRAIAKWLRFRETDLYDDREVERDIYNAANYIHFLRAAFDRVKQPNRPPPRHQDMSIATISDDDENDDTKTAPAVNLSHHHHAHRVEPEAEPRDRSTSPDMGHLFSDHRVQKKRKPNSRDRNQSMLNRINNAADDDDDVVILDNPPPRRSPPPPPRASSSESSSRPLHRHQWPFSAIIIIIIIMVLSTRNATWRMSQTTNPSYTAYTYLLQWCSRPMNDPGNSLRT